jgi:hypothetical protein
VLLVPFIGVEAGRWAIQEELDGQRWWVLMTFSTPVTSLKIKGNEREGDRMEQRLDYSSGGGWMAAWHGGARQRSVDL